MDSLLGLILARGGSKGIPKKNIKSFCGKPLIYWTIRQAIQSGIFHKIVVSTDCEEIATVSKAAGAEVPFKRPENLAADNSSSIDAMIHAITTLGDAGHPFENVCLLEPTSPLRDPVQLKDIYDKFTKLKSHYDSLITIGRVRDSYELFKSIKNEDLSPLFSDQHLILQRQKAQIAYFPYGVAYFCKVNKLFEEKTVYTKKSTYFIIDDHQCYEIDHIDDFIVNECLFMKHYYNAQISY